jgi:hypothetical protein
MVLTDESIYKNNYRSLRSARDDNVNYNLNFFFIHRKIFIKNINNDSTADEAGIINGFFV